MAGLAEAKSRPSGGGAGRNYARAGGVFAVSLLFYLWTLAPTVLWGDAARYQALAHLGQVPRGLREHPLWLVAAHAFGYIPLGDPAFRANLASAVFAALTLGFLYLAVVLLTNHSLAGMLAAGALAVSHTFWLHAVMAEVYSLNALFLALCLYLALGWGEGKASSWLLYACGFFLGLSLANHLLMLTAIPGFALYIAGRRKMASLPGGEYGKLALAFLLGALPFFYWGLLPTWQPGGASFGAELGRPYITDLALAGGYLGYQFFLSLPLALVGLMRLLRERRDLASTLALLYLGDFAFALGFQVPDQYAFYLPSYVVVAIFCGVGWGYILERWNRAGVGQAGLAAVLVLLPIAAYRITPTAFQRLAPDLLPFRALPTREPFGFFLFPSKRGYLGARTFTQDTLGRLPENSFLLADWTLLTPLEYLQKVEGRRPDVKLLEALPRGMNQAELLLRESTSHPAFIADVNEYYQMEAIREHFRVTPFGYIYRLEPKG